jgi:hypothetical protein
VVQLYIKDRKKLFLVLCTFKWEKNATLNTPGPKARYTGENVKGNVKSVPGAESGSAVLFLFDGWFCDF